jgi:hypothetical protein
MRPAPLGLLAPALLVLAALTFHAPPAPAEPHNGGAAISIAPLGIRVPFCIVPQPDSGALVVTIDTRNNAHDFFVQRTDRHGHPTLGTGGALLMSLPIDSYPGGFIPDGAGGCIFAWSQNRGATGSDILVQRVLANGSLAFAPTGLVVCSAALEQTGPALAAGAAGFFYVAWSDGRANVSGVDDIFVQRLSIAGAAQFAVNGIAANTIAYRTYSGGFPAIASDLLGGLLLQWNVASGGIRAQRVSSAGAMQYTAAGAPLADPGDTYARMAADGSGGLWAATSRFEGSVFVPYVHHLTSTGASSFAPAGIAIHGSNPGGFNFDLVRNASGGCFIFALAWSNTSTTGSEFFRQEVDASGALLRGANGQRLSYNANGHFLYDTGSWVVLALDEFGGADLRRNTRIQRFAFDGTPAFPGNGVIVGRRDPQRHEVALSAATTSSGIVMEAHADGRYARPGFDYLYEAFGQALDTAGNPLWDDAENPTLAAVKDSPGDQGGMVRMTWASGAGDLPDTRAISGYRGWRSLDNAPAAKPASMRPEADAVFGVDGRRYVLHAGAYWEEVASMTAAQLPNYALTLPTGQDSTASGSADESFMVEAYDDSSHHWWSGAMTAHSVDNLAPATPSPFTGQFTGGNVFLNWNPNTEPDLFGYRLYRGTTLSFVPGPANLVSASPNVGWFDLGAAPAIYRLSAVDIHGNESLFATVLPNGTLAVGDGPPRALAFALASSNPARGRATLRLALPSASHVRVAIYDAAGRVVRVLASGGRPAGTTALEWNGADAGGQAAPSGLYFARLETAGISRSVRFALTR